MKRQSNNWVAWMLVPHAARLSLMCLEVSIYYQDVLMDYSKIIEELKKESSFNLYRLRVAIDQQLENPLRLYEIKKSVRIGQHITYFDARENRLIEAKIIRIMRTKLLVENTDDRQQWKIPFYSINLGGVNTNIVGAGTMGLDKCQLKVGDMVGFQDNENNDIHGKIIRLNQKTVTIKTGIGTQWRVGYEWLYLIIDVRQGDPNLIEVDLTTIDETKIVE